MPFLLAAGLGLVIGLVLGGRPSNLLEVRIRAWPLLVVPVAWRLAELAGGDEGGWQRAALPYAFPAVLLALALFAAWNWRLPALPLIAAGAALNALVVIVNGGRMPIPLGLVRAIGGAHAAAQLAESGSAGTYTVLDAHTHLAWLADVMLLPGPLPRALSLGDVVLMVGLIAAITFLLNRSSPVLARFRLRPPSSVA